MFYNKIATAAAGAAARNVGDEVAGRPAAAAAAAAGAGNL